MAGGGRPLRQVGKKARKVSGWDGIGGGGGSHRLTRSTWWDATTEPSPTPRLPHPHGRDGAMDEVGDGHEDEMVRMVHGDACTSAERERGEAWVRFSHIAPS